MFCMFSKGIKLKFEIITRYCQEITNYNIEIQGQWTTYSKLPILYKKVYSQSCVLAARIGPERTFPVQKVLSKSVFVREMLWYYQTFDYMLYVYYIN